MFQESSILKLPGKGLSLTPSDFQETQVEFPPLGPLMPGRIKIFANTANDFAGYIIPKSQWDNKELGWVGPMELTEKVTLLDQRQDQVFIKKA